MTQAVPASRAKAAGWSGLLGERLRLIRALPERVSKGETLTADEILVLDGAWRYLHAIRSTKHEVAA